jgi:putative ABC transport system substrate-binding protein
MALRLRVAGVLIGLVLLLLAMPPRAGAQQVGRIARVGELWFAEPAQPGFRQGLRDLGYVEGGSIAFETRFARGNEAVLPMLAADLVRLGVEVILVIDTPALEAARRATKTIPIVMAGFGDPVAEGFVTALARPGGNITGVSWLTPEVSGKRLELLREFLPKVSRVALLLDPTDAIATSELKAARAAARVIGVTLNVFEVRDARQLEKAFADIKNAYPDALVVVDTVRTFVDRARIASFAAAARLPLVSEERAFADAGGLMTYGPSVPDLYKRAATYVDKILKGARPADLPIEQPKKFELVINARTAKALGLTIPPSLLLRADHVID